MDDITVDRIFLGSLHDLPVVNSKVVRIFTSSTFTDMSMERNYLMQNVYPKLKDYCKEKFGLEFQVVDMRWGVRDEATDDHSTTELCLKEIKNCQKLSVGPNFVVFLGEKYGYRPIPTYISSDQYFKIQRALKELKCDHFDVLDKWYKEDTNTIPPENEDLQEIDQRKWWQTLQILQTLLRKAADYLHANNELSDEERHNFFMSVTEREVIHGLLNREDTKSECLAYVRRIKNMDFQETKTVGKFVDLLPNREIDIDAQELLSNLRDFRLPSKIAIAWNREYGLNESENQEYLNVFSQHFYRNVTKLIRRSMKKVDRSNFGKIVFEILQHSHTCNSITEVFLGRNDEIEKLEKLLMSRDSCLLLVEGGGGSGKTSILA
ncbi:NACHT and WD repeat domain-containing protein 2-like protein, partial [Leptotrombidium deliense]